jgi:TonB family protein
MTAAIRLTLAIVFINTAPAGAQDALAPVRELYASAAYEDALSALDRLKGEAASERRLEFDRYEVLCLIALGRSTEANRVIETIITTDPLYRPGASEAAPHVRAAFAAVRRRVLPGLVRDLYAEGKRSYDRKAFADASEKLEQALHLIDDPDLADLADLRDLSTLVTGFLELSRSRMPPQIPLRTNPVEVAISSPPAAPAPVEPVVVRQHIPKWTFALAGALYVAEFRGAIEIDIDERGDVTSAQIVRSIHPMYDPMLLAATRDWKYQPARRLGKPVKTRKRVDIVLRPR